MKNTITISEKKYKYGEAIDNLRDYLYKLSSSLRLYDVWPENSQVIIVDSKIPVLSILRTMSTYDKTSVLLYDQDSNNILGEFNINDIIDFIFHSYLLKNNHTYNFKFAFVMSLFATPGIIFSNISLLFQNLNTNKSFTLQSLLKCDKSKKFKYDQQHKDIYSSLDDLMIILQAKILNRNNDSLKDWYYRFKQFAPYPASKIENIINGLDNNQSILGNFSDDCNSNDENHITLAIYISCFHLFFIEPFPFWFSVKLLESPIINFKSLVYFLLTRDTLSGIFHKKFSKFLDNSSNTHDKHNYVDFLEKFNSKDIRNDFYDTIIKYIHVLHLPLPWMYTVEFWKRLSGFNLLNSSILSLSPNFSLLEVIMLFSTKKLSQAFIWNSDMSIPVHSLHISSIFTYILNNLHTSHDALDLLVISDLNLGVDESKVLTVYPTTTLYQIFNIFRQYLWRYVPVIEEGTRKFLGLFSHEHIIELTEICLENSIYLDLDQSLNTIMEKFFNVSYTSVSGESRDILHSNRLSNSIVLSNENNNNNNYGRNDVENKSFNNYIQQAKIITNDISLRDAINLIMRTVEQRIVIINPISYRISKLLTLVDLIYFLFDVPLL